MGLEPLVVTAHLPHGFVATDPWSPAIDAILAYWALYAQLGEEALALNLPGTPAFVEAELPLGREVWGDLWWWQCSAPLYDQAAPLHVTHYHRRFDAQAAETRTTAGRVEVRGGPYKALRQQTQTRLAPQIAWHCIGDAEEIRRLLRRCDAVGALRGQGYGVVTRWTVEPGGEEALARFQRPLPVDFATERGISGSVLRWGIRPPGWLPQHKTLCVLP